jgi:hypothetical protein
MRGRASVAGAVLSLVLVGCGADMASDPPPAVPPPPTAPPPGEAPLAQAEPAPPPPPTTSPQGQAQPGQSASTDASQSAVYAPGPVPEQAPPPANWVYAYPQGQWVYASGYGWMWVPAGTATTEMEGVPYAYIYTPTYGWTWYVSPWGWGRYHYGVWVRHPFYPRGWRGGWVAHPRVVVRLGGRGHFRR